MAIIPTVRCRRMEASIPFYTKVLDFEWVDGDDDNSDPSFSVLMQEGHSLILSSHKGDATFLQALFVQTDDVEALFRKFRMRGLKKHGNPDAPEELHEGPIVQS